MGGNGFIFIIHLLTMWQHLEMSGQPMRVYLPDATNALRGSTLVHLKKMITLYSLIVFNWVRWTALHFRDYRFRHTLTPWKESKWSPFPPYFTNAITVTNIIPKNTVFNLLTQLHPMLAQGFPSDEETFKKTTFQPFLSSISSCSLSTYATAFPTSVSVSLFSMTYSKTGLNW